ncbi:MAG: hypothetical protein Q4C54_04595 [Clostridia bacterium]|nr:hypothetical protein [Clostridia bacterium]
MAASSGLIAGIVDVLFVGEFSLDRAKEYGEKDVNNLVIKTAQKFGYDGNNIKDAIECLEKKFPFNSDRLVNEFGGAKQHHLWDFSHHFSVLGLLCAILTQFTGKVFGTNKDGIFIVREVPDYQIKGKNFVEKILFGTVNWFFHMVSDMAGSSQCIGRGTGIPGPIVSLLKSVSSLPFFRNKKIGETEFHTWVSKLFNGTLLAKRNADNKITESMPFDLRTEIGILHEGSRQLVPVLINEAIVRGVYCIRRLCREIEQKDIHSIADLGRIDAEKVLPFNTPAIKRMCTIASGVFCVVDSVDALVHSLVERKVSTFFLHLNFVGVARFVLAIGDDYTAFLQETQIEREKSEYRSYRFEREVAKLDWFELDAEQTQLLYSLERLVCLHDANNTKDEKKKAQKIKWLHAWEESAVRSLRLAPGEEQHYFLDDEELFRRFSSEKNEKTARMLITLEAVTFKPYFPTNEDEIAACKELKLEHRFMDTIFLQRQHAVQRKELNDIKNAYQWYYDAYSGTIRNRWLIGIGTAAATALTAGVALHFAPAIAVALVGKGAAALSGAALTSFSLAAIGGGAIAAGGLGMAGGTMIIAGGGAIVGLLGGATLTSAASMLLLEADGYVLNECAKLLSYSEKVLVYEPNAGERINALANTISTRLDTIKQRLNV